MNDLDVFVFLLNVYFHVIHAITFIPGRRTRKFGFSGTFAACKRHESPPYGRKIPIGVTLCLSTSMRVSQPAADGALNARRAGRQVVQSVHPGCFCRLVAFHRTVRTLRLDRIGELDSRHPKTFDHDSRHPEAQSLLFRVTNETSQCHHVIFYRHQQISSPVTKRSQPRSHILSAEAASASTQSRRCQWENRSPVV